MNAFTDASRDARLKLDIEGLCATLRAPEVLHRIVMECKPATVSTGDFTLKALLDSIIDALKVRGDYRAIQRLLGAVFGEQEPNGTSISSASPRVPVGASGAERHPARGAGR